MIPLSKLFQSHIPEIISICVGSQKCQEEGAIYATKIQVEKGSTSTTMFGGNKIKTPPLRLEILIYSKHITEFEL